MVRLKILYKFRDMPHIVFCNDNHFYRKTYCYKNRTSEQKKLDHSKGYIYYRSNKVYLPTLRARRIEVKENVYLELV